ncbi:MAG: hypothetical protein AB8I08_39925 [Sandaracinaceae bacterium]
MSSLEIHERLERSDDYRGDHARPTVEVVRQADSSLDLPLRRTWAWDLAVLSSGLLVASGLATAVHANALAPGSVLPAIVACAAWVGVGLLRIAFSLRNHAQTSRRATAAAKQNLLRVGRLRIQDDTLHADAREDERELWNGRARLADVRAVRVVEEAGLCRVRVELDGGREVTALEGIQDAKDAERVAKYLRRQARVS